MKTASLFRALAHRNFRLFFIGQGTSLIGMWMQHVAMSWLVYQLTGSSLSLGLVLFFAQVPSLFLSPFVGIYLDRWDRARVFEVCQWLSMVQAFAMAALALTGVIQVWHVMGLSFLLGVTTSFDMAARQALTIRLVEDKKDLQNAIALAAAMFNGSRLIGPALGGLVLAASSAGVCFFINGLSFVAVLVAIYLMRLPPPDERVHNGNVASGIKDGLLYVWNFVPLRYILLLLSLGSVTSSVYSVLLPVYTVQAIGGGEQEMGWLGAAVGVGAFSAALFLAAQRSVQGVEKWIGAGACIMGLALWALSHFTNIWMALAVFPFFGFGMVAHFASGNTIIQTIVAEDKRGRVMSLYTMALIGMTPLGCLLSGYLNDHMGYAVTLTINGVLALAFGFMFLLWLPKLRGHLQRAAEAPVYP